MSEFGNINSTKASTKSPTPPPRKDGLTYGEGAKRQGQMLNNFYVEDDVEREALPSPPPQQKKRTPAKKNRKRSAPSITDDVETPPAKKTKPAPKHSSNMSSGTDSAATPSRRSTRVKSRTKPFDEIDDEQESPLAKKSKKKAAMPADAPEQQPLFDVPGLERHSGRGNSGFKPINQQLKQTSGPATSRRVKVKTDRKAAKAKQEAAPDAALDAAPEAAPDAVADAVTDAVADAVNDERGEPSNAKAAGKSKVAAPAATKKPKKSKKKAAAAPSKKGSGKKKSSDPAFQGTAGGMGSSLEKPAGAPNDASWHCAKRDCSTGQTWYNRDGKDPYGRKSISQFFGRNKKETNSIHKEVWHNFCRKDYQREKYKADKGGLMGLGEWQIKLIRAQLMRIKIWRQTALFTIQLSKTMQLRKADWFGMKRRNNNNMARTQAEFDLKYGREADISGQLILSPEEAFSCELAEHFDNNFSGANKTFDQVEAAVAWAETQLEAETIEQLPPMEFLIDAEHDGDILTAPQQNYVLWAQSEDAAAANEAAIAANEDGDDAGDDGGDDAAPGPDDAAKVEDPMAGLNALADAAAFVQQRDNVGSGSGTKTDAGPSMAADKRGLDMLVAAAAFVEERDNAASGSAAQNGAGPRNHAPSTLLKAFNAPADDDDDDDATESESESESDEDDDEPPFSARKTPTNFTGLPPGYLRPSNTWAVKHNNALTRKRDEEKAAAAAAAANAGGDDDETA